MKINHRIRTLLSVIVMAMVLPLSAQTPQCKDTAEHHRLQAEMWAAATGNDPEKVYLAAVKFQNHADDEGDYEGHYNAWMCGVAFNLDRMNISDAYHIAAVLKEDLETGKGGQEEQYMGPMMMGQVYNVCGNVSGAINELKEAIRLVKGTRYEESTLISLYMALAHLTLTTDPDQSLQWVDEGIQVLNEHQQWSVYQKRLGGAYAMKSIICFKKGDYDNCRFWYDKAMEAHGGEPEGYTGIFMTYAEIYHHAIDGHLQEALKITDSIKSLKERYLIKCDLYQYGGEMDKAFDTQHQLLLLNDSIRGTMMAENISQMEHEKQLMTYQQKMSRLMNIILAITIGLAILAIILMTRNILIRRRSRKRLLAKNEELREANRKVTRADEMKTQFIRNVSHEIRTPLNIINGFTQVLTDEENTFEPEERHEIAETIGTSTRQITSLVNKMLALANQNTKDLLKEVEDTDALDICHKALQEMPPVDADRVKVELEDLTHDKGTTLCTNSDSLLQMLGNILENSVKFTEKGTIKLTLRNDGLMMWFTVEDTGCGIPEDKISTIFERFVKVDEFKEGLGLGLAYCHETAERLGGVLRLDSTSEAGTSFTLGLPLKVKN
jgi:signal transduction histidine kinase